MTRRRQPPRLGQRVAAAVIRRVSKVGIQVCVQRTADVLLTVLRGPPLRVSQLTATVQHRDGGQIGLQLSGADEISVDRHFQSNLTDGSGG